MSGIALKGWDYTDRPRFIGLSDARIITGDEEAALLRLRREKRGEAESKEPSGNPRPTHPCDRTSTKPSPSPVRAAHAAFVDALAGHPPRPIPIDADAIDLEDRADHLNTVLGALSVYVTVILDDTAQNVPGGLELPDIEAVLADLTSDVTGTIQLAADGVAGRVA